jgi:hypothetical protein
MLGAQVLHELEAVGVLQRDVDHCYVRVDVLDQLKGGITRSGLAAEDHVHFRIDGVGKGLPDRRMIVDHDDANRMTGLLFLARVVASQNRCPIHG